MDAFPAYFPLAGRRVIIAGSGEPAVAKARLFEGSPATIVRLDGEAAFDPDRYRGAVLAFVATSDDAFAISAVAAARSAGVPVNAADRPQLCDFMTPAVIDRGEVVAAVGTGGSAPLLASLLRADIEARLPEGAGWIAVLLRRSQDKVREAFPDLAARRAFLRSVLDGPVAEAALRGDLEAAEALMRAAIEAGIHSVGCIWFVDGAGPAHSLTLAAARVLAQADVLAIDAGADPQVVRLARRDAPRLEAAARTDVALADLARQGLQVVRIAIGQTAAEAARLEASGAATRTAY